MPHQSSDLLNRHAVKNLYHYPLDEPKPFIALPKNSAFIIPDLHANPLLLLHYLLRSRIMNWPQNGKIHWERLVAFYEEPIPTPQHTSAGFRLYMKKFSTEFEKILKLAQFDRSHPLLLLGDVLGDRGQNDWYMLLLLHVLKEKKIQYRINFSNHDYETYCWARIDKFSKSIHPGLIMNGQRVSLINFNGIYPYCSYLRKKRMRHIYRRSYLPYVTLFAYYYNKRTRHFIITTHAPGSFMLICDIAKEWNIPYAELDNPQQLSALLNACNAHFRTLLIKHPQYLQEKYCVFPTAEKEDKEKNYPALLRAIWGRHDEYAPSRHPTLKHYTMTWICGHLGAKSHPQHVINLDASDLGKRNFGTDYEFERRKKPIEIYTTGSLCYSFSAPEMVTQIPINKN